MLSKNKGYERFDNDLYETPEWASEVILPFIPSRVQTIWEPACGSGQMVEVFRKNGYLVRATDITTGNDFMQQTPSEHADAIITNPPYNIAGPFIRHALDIVKPDGFVAMLLRYEFDAASSRADLFANNPYFAFKLVMTQRIRWIEGTKGRPSIHHAWFVWDKTHTGPCSMRWHFRNNKTSAPG